MMPDSVIIDTCNDKLTRTLTIRRPSVKLPLDPYVPNLVEY